MAGRFPGAKNVDEYWQNLCAGRECISFFSDEELLALGVDQALLNNPSYVKAGAPISDIEMFDASFFGFSPKEAEVTDPQQRIFLECAWEALENAGYDSEAYKGWIGVYAGGSLSSYLIENLLLTNFYTLESLSRQFPASNDKDYIPTRVSYKLNLKGPSLNVNTTCSTSLVAVHLACRGLLNYECDMALAGGVSIQVPHQVGYLYLKEGMASPDGHCRAFDANAQGTIMGNGVGIVVLKRLEDALAEGDCIYAVIKGSAINNDGSAKVGFTAPSTSGQAKVIAEAQAIADINPETISYIETHGTGTILGDPIEISALKKVFNASTEKKGFCAIGSVKTNVGHLNTASGVAGLIKTVLALKHQVIPPNLHFETPNPEIDFEDSPFYVNTKLSEWKTNGTPRRAGVSSFGFGGTNAHVVLEEAPPQKLSEKSRPWQLLVISAKTDSALEMATENLKSHLQEHPHLDLADVAYTLQLGRRAFDRHRFVVCQDIKDAVSALTANSQRVLTHHQKPTLHPIAFMFSGQGSQYVNMGRELYQLEPTFQEQVDKCAEILQPHLGLDLRHILYPNSEQTELATQQLQQTALAQPALFVIEYSLAQLWLEWGIRPVAMIGHSIGEYVAATIAGVFSLEDALAVVATRGKLMQQMPTGSMLAVPLTEQQVQPLLYSELSIAAVNAPSSCVVSGPTSAIEALQQQLAAQGIDTQPLFTSHAFHSAMMEPVVQKFTQRLQQVNLQPPQIPYISNLTGTWITADEATNPDYWAKHLRQPVRFSLGVSELLQQSDSILVEVGPGRSLSTLTKRHLEPSAKQLVLSSLHHPKEQHSDISFLLNTLGRLWMAGVEIDWSGFYAHEKRSRLPLPTYPFERQRYWIDSKPRSLSASALNDKKPDIAETDKTSSSQPYSRLNLGNPYVAATNELETQIAQMWQEVLGMEEVGIHDNFFELGGDSLIATRLFSRLQTTFPVELSMRKILFQAPTIAQQAEMLDRLLFEKIAELSEEEVNSILVN
ncbi:beta-ketoacyl synthase N-terminal-like domain-containing protein [Nostoc sp. C117]|uniref:type I polyketide synthase n=1 Tax=Nostoc sp. C117 TaxID=3349875 RepID=UPI00370DCB82